MRKDHQYALFAALAGAVYVMGAMVGGLIVGLLIVAGL